MSQGKVQTIALVATLATAVIAGGKCDPKEVEYLCDNEKGEEVLTTYTMYPKGCAGYTQYPGVNDWEVWPTSTTTKSADPWNTWSTTTTKTKSADPWNTWPAGKDPKDKDPKGKDWNKKDHHDDDSDYESDDEDDKKKWGKDGKPKEKDPKEKDPKEKDPKKKVEEDDWSSWPDSCKYGKTKEGKDCRPKYDDKWCRGSKDRYGKDCKDSEWNDWEKTPCKYGKDKDGKKCGSSADEWSNWQSKPKKDFGWHNKDYDYWGKDNNGKYYKDYDNNGCDYYGYDKDGKYVKEHDNSGYDCYGYDVAGKYNKYYNYYDCEESSEWQEWDSDDEHKHFNKGYDYNGKNKKGEYKKECDNKGKNFYGYDKDGKYDAECDNKGYDHYGYHKDGHYSKYWTKVDSKDEEWNKWVDPKKDGKKVVTITLTETYKVPCSTGWETKTKTFYTTHCGCTETPVPTKPSYSTYTTECPESWSVGKTVTVTVPYGTWTPDAAAATWSTWATPAASSTWASWSVTITKTPDATKTPEADKKCDYVTKTYTTKECGKKENDGKTGYGSNEWENCKDVVKTTSTYASTCTWAPWSVTGTPVKGYETATPAAWSPVAVWKGAAPATAVSRGMIAIAGAVAGVVYFL